MNGRRAVHAYGIGGVVISALLFWWLVAAPISTRHATAAQARDDLAEARRQSIELRKSSAMIETRMARIDEQMASYQVNLQPPTALSERLADLTAVASASSMTINSMKPGITHERDDYEAVEIRLGATATYTDTIQFMSSVHEQLPDVDIIEFSLTAQQAGESMSASVQIVLHWYTSGTHGTKR